MNYQAINKTAVHLKNFKGVMLTKLRDVQVGEAVDVLSITGNIATVDVTNDPTATAMGYKIGYVFISDFTPYTAFARRPQQATPILMEPGADEEPLPLPVPLPLPPVLQDNTPPVRQTGINTPLPLPTGGNGTGIVVGIRTKKNVLLDIPEEVINNPNDSGALLPTGGIKAPTPADPNNPAQPASKAATETKRNPLLMVVVAILVVIVLIRIFK